MTTYRVKLTGTYSETVFDFTDYYEAMGFIGIALENGTDSGKDMSATVSIVRQEVGLSE